MSLRFSWSTITSIPKDNFLCFFSHMLIIFFFLADARTPRTVLSDSGGISILTYDFNRNGFRVAIFE